MFKRSFCFKNKLEGNEFVDYEFDDSQLCKREIKLNN